MEERRKLRERENDDDDDDDCGDSSSSTTPSSPAAGSEDKKLRVVKSPDPCLLCGEPAVHYDWEGNVIKREEHHHQRQRPSRLHGTSGRGGGGDDDDGDGGYSDDLSLFTCVFKCFGIPGNQTQRLLGNKDFPWSNNSNNSSGARERPVTFPVCESCEELVGLLLQVYNQVEELEENLKNRIKAAETKFVEEELYEKHHGIYGTFRGILSVKKKRQKRNRRSSRITNTTTVAAIKDDSGRAHSPSSSQDAANFSTENTQEESSMKCEEEEEEQEDKEVTNVNIVMTPDDESTSFKGNDVTTAADLVVRSCMEQIPSSSSSHLTQKVVGQSRRMSPRRKPPTTTVTTYAESSSSAEEEEEESERGSDTEFNNYDLRDHHDESSGSPSGSSSDCKTDNEEEEAAVSNNVAMKESNEGKMMEEVEDVYTKQTTKKKASSVIIKAAAPSSKSILLNHRKRKLAVAESASSMPPEKRPNAGICPVCEKPFESIKTVAYYAHRMTHLSESEKAASKPTKYKGGHARPRIPTVRCYRRKLTPEQASLRGDVRQCPTCGKLVAGGAWRLGQHEKTHLRAGPNRKVGVGRRKTQTRHQCSICHLSSCSKQALALHMARAHKNSEDDDDDNGNPRGMATNNNMSSSSGSHRRRPRRLLDGMCPVCFKPFDSTLSPEYYAHRLTHLSEEERLDALSNPVTLSRGKKKKTRPKLPKIRIDERGRLARVVAGSVPPRNVNQCPTCGKIIRGGTQGLRLHENTHLAEEERKVHLCAGCGARFTTKSSMYKHNLTFHAGEIGALYQCKYCTINRVFKTEQSLLKHVRKNHAAGASPAGFPCSQCSRSFRTAKVLKCHITRNHVNGLANVGTWTCRLCRKKLGSKEERLEHYKEAHPDSNLALPPPHPHDDNPVLLLRCNYPNCGQKGFPDESSLQSHVGQEHHAFHRQGTSKKKSGVMCSLCGKVLVHEWSLQQHLRRHSGEKSHNCTCCNASFRHLGSLHGHLASVHGVGPLSGTFKCEQPGCESVLFQSRIQYGAHMRNVHKVYLTERKHK